MAVRSQHRPLNTTSLVNFPGRAVRYGDSVEFSDVIRMRKMTRHFLAEPVPNDTVDRLLETALRAPSAGFVEGVDLLVLSTAHARARFWSVVADPEWLSSPPGEELSAAPVLIVVCCDPDRYVHRYREPDKVGSSLHSLEQDAWPVPYWIVDASFVTHGLLLGATDAGFGALFFHLQGRAPELVEEFDVPKRILSIGAVALGYEAPATRERSTKRHRPTNEAVHHGRW